MQQRIPQTEFDRAAPLIVDEGVVPAGQRRLGLQGQAIGQAVLGVQRQRLVVSRVDRDLDAVGSKPRSARCLSYFRMARPSPSRIGQAPAQAVRA
jgi:hypothetical protein